VAGSWRKSLDSIRAIASLGVSPVAVSVLTKINCLHIEKTLLFLKDNGITRIMLNRINIGGRNISQWQTVGIEHDELRAAFRVANELADRENLSLTSNVCTSVCVLDPSAFPHISFGHCATDPARMPLTLDWAGNVRLCNHSPVVIGNIFKEDFAAMFSSDYVKRWRKIPGFCRDCVHAPTCLGGCRAAAEQTGSSIDLPDPYLAHDRN